MSAGRVKPLRHLSLANGPPGLFPGGPLYFTANGGTPGRIFRSSGGAQGGRRTRRSAPGGIQAPPRRRGRADGRLAVNIGRILGRAGREARCTAFAAGGWPHPAHNDPGNLVTFCRRCHIEAHRPPVAPDVAAWRELLRDM